VRRSDRVSSLRSYGKAPSLLDGDGSTAVSLLSIPSPPGSRSSSAQGSYANTEFEEDGDEPRGRLDDKSSTAEKRMSGKDVNKGNVVVSVRVRPDQPGEHHKSDLEWMVDGRRSLVSYRGREGGEYTYGKQRNLRWQLHGNSLTYKVDNVFTVHDNNAKVYDSAAKRLVRRVMEGYHGTVFAYGMTGTGKTFSMQGTATSPGVIPLAITDIFSYIRETPHREYLLRVSYLEIYNEKIHDLLSPPGVGLNGKPVEQEEIKLREDSKRGVYATPLKEEIVQSPTQLLRVIARGDNARRVASTAYNNRSSRSHAVVQIVVESRERAPVGSAESKRQGLPPGGVRVSTLSLIDLAGSERAADNKERRTEGAHINKSLLTLGTVISKLSGERDKDEKDAKTPDKQAASKDNPNHLPYRDSKLTRLLQPALQGNSLISILCTIQIGSAGSVATAQNHTMETLNTLKFASRAKNNIVSHAKKAEEAFAGDAGSRALLDRYRMEIQELRKQLESKDKVTQKGRDEEEDKRDTEALIREEKEREEEDKKRHEEQMLEMQLARTALKERIEHLNRLILSSKSLGVNAARSFSSLSMQRGRESLMTNGEGGTPGARSAHSSARSSTATLEAPAMAPRRSSSDSLTPSFRASTANEVINELDGPEDEEVEDSLGENGDGMASKDTQIRALQADLADKNRYISTLEKRLLQARRSSHSRVSMTFGVSRASVLAEDGGVDAVLREKDAEIAELRARLDDKERMVSALRSAARKRDMADLRLDTSVDRRLSSNAGSATGSANPLIRENSHSHALGLGLGIRRTASNRSTSVQSVQGNSPAIGGIAGGVGHHAKTNSNSRSLSPLGALSPVVGSADGKKVRSVDEMTRMLDEMITERVQSGATGGPGSPSAATAGAAGGALPGVKEEVRVDSGVVVPAKHPAQLAEKRRSSVRILESPRMG
jgi:centromeric protein E